MTLASSPILVVSPQPQPYSYPLFCMQLLKHVANIMQRAEGFVLSRESSSLLRKSFFFKSSKLTEICPHSRATLHYRTTQCKQAPQNTLSRKKQSRDHHIFELDA